MQLKGLKEECYMGARQVRKKQEVSDLPQGFPEAK